MSSPSALSPGALVILPCTWGTTWVVDLYVSIVAKCYNVFVLILMHNTEYSVHSICEHATKYLDSANRLDETFLPLWEALYSYLTERECFQEDYDLKVWSHFS